MYIDPLEAAMSRHRVEAARILRGVAALFSDPARWTQGGWARRADGMFLTRALDDRATCWCLLGAVRKVRGPGMTPAEDLALKALRSVVWPDGRAEQTLADWNDAPSRRVEHVAEVARRAAEHLESHP